MPNETYTSFLKDPDEVARRAELEAFFGPRAAKFLKTYEAQAAIAQRAPGEKIRSQFF